MPNKNTLKKTLNAGLKFTIINGPTAAAFVDAFKYAFGTSKMTVDLYFEIDGILIERVAIQILSIKHVGMVGDCFDFEAAVHDKRFGGDHYLVGQYSATVPHGYFIVRS